MTADETIDAIARDVHALVSTGPQPDTLLIPASTYAYLLAAIERERRKERRARAQARKKKRGW